MNCRLAGGSVKAAAQRLAIDRNHLAAADFVDRRNQLQQALLKLIDLDGSQDRIEPIMRGNPGR